MEALQLIEEIEQEIIYLGNWRTILEHEAKKYPSAKGRKIAAAQIGEIQRRLGRAQKEVAAIEESNLVEILRARRDRKYPPIPAPVKTRIEFAETESRTDAQISADGNRAPVLAKAATMLISVCFFAAVFFLTACTENQRARQFGGKTEIPLRKNQRLVNATWKDQDLWVLTRPMKEGESPETYSFEESSSFGVWEGRVVFKESK